MNNKNSTIIGIFVLTSIVIVPTLCLLWFMEQAVSNERLLVHQKLADVYIKKIEDFNWSIDQFIDNHNEIVKDDSAISLISDFYTDNIDGLIIVRDNEIKYPKKNRVIQRSSINTKMWKMEYEEKEFKKVATLYKDIADTSSILFDKIDALMGSARCYKKANDEFNAIKIYQEILKKENYDEDIEQISYAKIALAKLYNKNTENEIDSILTELLLNINFSISSDTRLFMINASMDILKQRGCGIICDSAINKLKKLEKFEILSSKYVAKILDLLNNKNIKENEILKVDSIYLKINKENNDQKVTLFTKDKIVSWANILNKQFNDFGIRLNVNDEYDTTIFGNKIKESEPFYTYPLIKHSEGSITLKFYFDDNKFFQNGIKKQTASYVWIGILSIVFIVITVIFAGYFLIQQMNLNKLKNTFLATVTHELKTPISSTRVLIETLRDGKIKEYNKIQEYYKLIAKENFRLGRLVDNFLTFSRMERNKEVHNKAECSISEIINIAIESMSVKLKNSDCNFSIEYLEKDTLINVNLDAIVTVITNLLDNAYKYGGKKKEIHLKTEIRDSNLIISIKDYGIGISKREISKIFNKFYRVDDKLSRSAEGCGLGLSIVKYILDSHNGTIKVESIENKGSTFIVSLPIETA